jgi:hypothetical protein
VTLFYSRTDSGDSQYRTVSVGLRWRPWDWLHLTAGVPYTFIDGEENITELVDDGLGNLVEQTTTFNYENSGIGDITVVAWINTLYPFTGRETTLPAEGGADADTVVAEDPFDSSGEPYLFFGAGLKLPTGIYDEFDDAKFVYDDSKNITGEYDISEGVLDPRFQLGTGTWDPMIGLVYQQRFWRFQPNLGASYTFTGGKNDVGYEFGDRVAMAASLRFFMYRTESGCQGWVSAGVNGVYVLEDDYDHSEDTTKLGSQPKGEVEDTKGFYDFYNLGIGIDLHKDLTLYGMYSHYLTQHDSDNPYSFDNGLSVGLQYRF